MDVVRFGLSIRALRRRRGWRQVDVAEQAGVSRTAVSRVERGRADRLTIRALDTIAGTLGARLDCRLLWNGEALDRLLDASHAALVETVVAWLTSLGWQVATEVSFSIRGERGSIDVFAFHPTTATLLVVEVKSVVPAHAATFAVAFPSRGWAVRRWLQDPAILPDPAANGHAETRAGQLVRREATTRARTPFSGLLFLPGAPEAGARHRVSARSPGGATTPRTIRVADPATPDGKSVG